MKNFELNNSDNLIDVRNLIERFEELEEMRTDRFVAGWNIPGYLPDSDPAEFDDADDALEYIKDEAKQAVEQSAIGETLDDATVVHLGAQDCAIDSWTADKNGEFGQTFGQFHYWVIRDGFMGLDADEQAEFAAIEELLSDLCGNGGDEQWRGDWYPITLIRDSYFDQAMDDLLEDCGDLPKDLPCYLTITVDYKALQMDYTSTDIDGVTYWYR